MKCNQWIEGTIDPHGLPYCRCGGDIPDQWRDVRDELPEEDGDYLVVISGGAVTTYRYYTGNYDNCGWYASAYYKAADVTHWMPLPAPPSGKE